MKPTANILLTRGKSISLGARLGGPLLQLLFNIILEGLASAKRQ